MKKSLFAAACVLACVPILILAQAPQGAAPEKGGKGGKGKGGPPAYTPPEGPAPKNPWGKPDFNGVWARPYVADITRDGGAAQKGSGPLPYTDWGKQQWESYKPEQDGDYTGACLPFGLMRSVNSPDPMQIVQTDKTIAFLFEQNTWFKVVPIGKPRGKKVPTWFGDSEANWDGDTLVIDTNNFNGLTRLDTNGHPHSNELHMIERYTRTDAGHAGYEVTVEDPKTFTRPWKNTRIFTLRTDWEVLEYSCEENNKGLIEGRIKVPNFGPAK